MAFNEEDIFGDDPMDARGGDPHAGQSEREWSKLQNEFTNAGFREGIVVGKEAALQDGFDHGFEHSGVPAGRQLGLLRGQASAALAIITKHRPDDKAAEDALREIVNKLSNLRMHEIVRDEPVAVSVAASRNDTHKHDDLLEVEQTEANKLDDLEVALARMGTSSQPQRREGIEELRQQLDDLLPRLGLRL